LCQSRQSLVIKAFSYLKFTRINTVKRKHENFLPAGKAIETL
jgi:hypothetical protein